ncbi:MAG: hypothetical protein DHS20C18_00760 [Saprospiraceae bacterium]|nr:MAG: hypothetical protein DHS20C18_00760 [Saprospiraceae bacterium]
MKKLLFSLSVLFLTCSFVSGPSATQVSLATAELKTMPPGGAYAMFAGKFGGEVSKKEIASHQKLTVEGCARGSRIFTFTLDITKNGKTSSLNTESDELTKEMLTKLNALSTGDTFIFRKMKAYLPNGKDVVDVQGRKFTVA